MDRLTKQRIINLLKRKINYPIYIKDSNNRIRKISDVFVENDSIFFKIDGHIDSLIVYSTILQNNLYNALQENVDNTIWID